jgi:hypothetical protein
MSVRHPICCRSFAYARNRQCRTIVAASFRQGRAIRSSRTCGTQSTCDRRDGANTGRAISVFARDHRIETSALLVVTVLASHILPMADNCNLLAYGAGGYTFKDFTRTGAPLLVIMWWWLMLSWMLPRFYPLEMK